MTLLPITDDLIADYVCYCEGAKESGYEDPMPFSVWRVIETEVRHDFEQAPEVIGFEPVEA